MQRKFLTNLGLLLLLNFLIKPFWVFGIDRTVQNIVGVGGYGFYFVVFNFSFLFNILLDLGITNFNNRNIAQNNQLLNKHFSGILTLKILLSVFYLLVTFGVALIKGYNVEQMKLLGFLAFNQFLISFILYLRSNISGLLFFRTDSFLSVLDRVLMIIFCGVLLWGNVTDEPFRIEWFVYAQTAAYLLTALIAFSFVVKKARFRRLSWNRPFFMMIIKQSAPFALLVLLMTLYSRLDPVMLELLLGDEMGNEQAGIYAFGYRLLDAANMIAYLFSVLLLPIFSKLLKDREPIEKMLRLSYTLIITPAIIVALGSHFYSTELMDLLYDAHITESSAVFSLLMFGFVAVSSNYIMGTLLTTNGNLRALILISLTGLIINILVNMVMVPRFLATGAALASLLTQAFTAVAQIIVVQKVFRFRVNYTYLLTLFIFAVGVMLINIFSRLIPVTFLPVSSTLNWLPGFALMIVGSLLLAGFLRLISIRSFLNILRSER